MIENSEILPSKICLLCNEKTLYAVKNQRSDASFEYFVHCKNCNKWVGKIDWYGSFSFLKNI